jgi:hypothetical protein
MIFQEFNFQVVAAVMQVFFIKRLPSIQFKRIIHETDVLLQKSGFLAIAD